MRRTRRLTVEALEDRAVPATFNNPWPDAGRLTLSFAPDGTAVGTQSSNLFATLNAISPTKDWQRQVLRAFQSWAQEANVNIGLVADGGQALGVGGKPQSDARFGDIRLGGGKYGNSVIAFSSPFDVLATTSSGDVRVNSDAFQGGKYDLFTALLQEAGHTLGIGHSADQASAQYELYLGPRAGISAGDAASIRALYGPRQADAFEGGGGNETLATAAKFDLLKDANGILSMRLEADLTTKTDTDVYSFRAPTLTTGLVVRLERAGVSLVTPRLTVYDAQGRVIGSTESTDPTGGDLELRLSGVTPLSQLYVKVEGAGDDSFRVGGYGLQVQSLALVNTLWGSVLSTVNSAGQALTNNDLHTNDSFLTANSLLSGLFAPDSKFDVAYQGSISDSWDVDYYKVQAPAQAAGDNVLTVMAWGTGSSSLLPSVAVYDAAYKLVPTQVLVNESGVVTVQAVGVKPGAAYYVKLDSAVSGGAAAVGNYFLGIDFGAKAAKIDTFAAGKLDSSRTQAASKLQVRSTATFQFVLEADTAAGVELAIRDASGKLLRTLKATSATPTSLNVTLEAGAYTFTVRNLGTGTVNYRIRGAKIDDPIGPQARDSSSSTTNEQTTGGSGGDTNTDWYSSNYWYYWSGDDTSGGGPNPQGGDNGYRA